MEKLSGIYLVTFSMKEPINSQTGWGEKAMRKGIMVTTRLAKVGKFENGEAGRRKNYQMTYGAHFSMEILWSGKLEKPLIRQLESTIKKDFKPYRYRSPLTARLTEYIDLDLLSISEVRSRTLSRIRSELALP